MLVGRRCSHLEWHGGLLIVHHHWQLSLQCACSRSKVPIAPMGKGLVDMSISILIFYDGCYLELPGWSTCHLSLKLQKFPSPRWEFLLTCPIDSHLSIRIDIWFYQGYVRASHACRLPIAPMVKWLTWLPRLSLAQLQTLRSTTECTCRRDLQKFPSPRWENC